MKKNLLLAGLLLAMTLSVSAQYKGFSFGFKLGPGFDWVGSTTGVLDLASWLSIISPKTMPSLQA